MEFTRLKKYVEYIDFLVHHECTGNPEEFAKKLGISVRTLFYHIQQLREMGINITYNRNKRSYIYGENGKLTFAFTKDELNNIRGGNPFPSKNYFQEPVNIFV